MIPDRGPVRGSGEEVDRKVLEYPGRDPGEEEPSRVVGVSGSSSVWGTCPPVSSGARCEFPSVAATRVTLFPHGSGRHYRGRPRFTRAPGVVGADRV